MYSGGDSVEEWTVMTSAGFCGNSTQIDQDGARRLERCQIAQRSSRLAPSWSISIINCGFEI